MSSRIFGVFLSPFSVFPAEEFKRFRRKPELLLLTGVKIVLLKVWRTVLDLLKGGRGGRHLISFFKTGIAGCFSLFSLLTFPLVRSASQFKGDVLAGQGGFMLPDALEAAPPPTAIGSSTEGLCWSTVPRVGFSPAKEVCFMSSFETGFEKSLNCLLEQGQFAFIPHFALIE